MRRVAPLLVAVTSTLTALFVVVAVTLTAGVAAAAPRLLPARHDPEVDLAHVERLLYHVPLATFLAEVARGDPWLDTSTDWCSAPGVRSTGRSFDFRGACRRHDFGYRNLQLLDRRYSCPDRRAGELCADPGRPGRWWNHESRERVDDQLLTDLRAHCRARRWYDRPTCLVWAEVFYVAVRLAGGP
jgi:hypothetical protein